MIGLIHGDALHIPLADETVQCVITSPPYYGLRDYGVSGQIGLEKTPEEYIAKMVEVFREVRRVMRPDGTLWLNMGDSYANNRGTGASPKMGDKQKTNIGSHLGRKIVPDGLKDKDLIGVPWMLAFALRADGWYLRSDIIWHKPNPMPESVTDRPTKAHEYLFLLSKSQRYYYDGEAIREPLSETTVNDPRMNNMGRTYNGKGRNVYGEAGKANGQMEAWSLNPNGRNRRSVWTIPTSPYSGAKSIADYVGEDGKPYKASPDCPIHGHLAHSRNPYMLSGDEQSDQIENDNPDIDNHHVQVPVSLPPSMMFHSEQDATGGNSQTQNLENIVDYKSEAAHPVSILPVQIPDHTNHISTLDGPSDHKQDFLGRKYAPSANGHNKRKSKTARARQTLQHDTASAETPAHIQSILPIPENIDSVGHISENNILNDGSPVRPSADIPSRNADRYSYQPLYCTCEIVTIDHFATFPPALVEPCLLAGTSERGCCPTCGAPWERVVEVNYHQHRKRGDWENRLQDANGENRSPGMSKYGVATKMAKTTGWRPSCSCPPADPVPCTVLDPFAGTFTVGMVAMKHRRNAVGIELNPKYIELARKRCSEIQVVML